MRTIGKVFGALALLLALGGCVTAGSEQAAAPPPQPVTPEPAAAALRPGLETLYFLAEMDHVRFIPSAERAAAQGRRGPPVATLDAIAQSGQLWDAGTRRNYALRFQGLIRLPAGETKFQALSNDGVRVFVDRTVVVDDPDVHADQLSPPRALTIEKAGWYPLTVLYFQKGGGAALQLYWTPPGAADKSIVPAAALAHLAAGG